MQYQEAWARYRKVLDDGIARALSDTHFSQADPIRDQISASKPGDYDMAALVCLRTADALCGTPEVAQPAATALAMVSQMSLVFSGLESQEDTANLSSAWGMPRALNAGDALFATAQHVLLSTRNEMTASRRSAALRLLDEAMRALVEALHGAVSTAEWALTGQRALLPAAVSLGALLAGADHATRDRLQQLASGWAALPEVELATALSRDLDTLTVGR